VTLSVDPHLLWGSFLALLAGCLAVDLTAHRRQREVVLGDALRWTAIWVGLAVACAGAVWLLRGGQAFLQFLAAYSVEWSLSADNVLVFAALIAGFAVPARHRHAVLFFGSLGAILLRLVFILAGSALLDRFGWLSYVFGAFLLVAAVRFLRQPAAHHQPGGAARTPRDLPALFGRLSASPLVLAALAVAVADLAFATDSIPAVFGMTHDPFIAFASNAMAVVGLRSTYFLLEAVVLRFRYLKPALVTLLAFVGLKMLVDPLIPGDFPVAMSLGAIVAILGTAALASWLHPRRASRFDRLEPLTPRSDTVLSRRVPEAITGRRVDP
jgi:tellurite resistance protein TerC